MHGGLYTGKQVAQYIIINEIKDIYSNCKSCSRVGLYLSADFF